MIHSDAPSARLRALVVDDSNAVRRLIGMALEAEGIEAASFAGSGGEALDLLAKLEVDVVLLDIEMPGMSGIDTLREIRRRQPGLGVLVFSSLTERGASTTIEALCAGANDYLAKPSQSGGAPAVIDWLRRTLVPKLRAVAARSTRSALSASRIPVVSAAGSLFPAAERGSLGPGLAAPLGPGLPASLGPGQPGAANSSLPTAPPLEGPVRAIAIGSSIGGPQVLTELIPRLRGGGPPVFLVQHMPPVFTTALATRLSALSQLRVREAEHGQRVEPGNAYLAPGDYHMRVAQQGAEPLLLLDKNPLENGCRPAVDVLFRSAAAVYGSGLLAVVLTGAGSDGTKGALAIRSAGGQVWAQDEASSAAWGMAGSVVKSGYAHRVYSIDKLGAELARILEARFSLRPRGGLK